MSKTEQVALIERAFDAMPNMTLGLLDEKAVLYRTNYESERKHRRGAPNGIGFGISKDVAAKLFTVQHIADALEAPERYDVNDILYIRAECLRAQALANLYGGEIRAAWNGAGVSLTALRSLDYAKLVNDGKA